MIGIATRYFAGRIALAIAAAAVLGVTTGMDGDGDVVFFGIVVLGTAAAAFALLAALALSVGDGDSNDRERLHRYPASPAYWPVMGALGLGVLMVGLATDGALAILGVAILIVAAVEWTVSAWSERLSTDRTANAEARDRLLAPFEIPLYGALAIAVPVFLVSRVFLASSKNGASFIGTGVMVVIVAFAFLLYAKPDIRKPVIATALVFGGIAVIASGIIAAAVGERDFEIHHEEEGGHGDEGGGSEEGHDEDEGGSGDAEHSEDGAGPLDDKSLDSTAARG